VVSHVWDGYGSTIFLELGDLSPGIRNDGSEGNPLGETSLMFEWDWRCEKARSILCGSTSTEARRLKALHSFRNTVIADVQLFGRLRELEVTLSNGLRILSFATSESQPMWAIICRKPLGMTLCMKRGKLVTEPLAS